MLAPHAASPSPSPRGFRPAQFLKLLLKFLKLPLTPNQCHESGPDPVEMCSFEDTSLTREGEERGGGSTVGRAL